MVVDRLVYYYRINMLPLFEQKMCGHVQIFLASSFYHRYIIIAISAMSGRKPSDVESEQENERDSEQIEMVKDTAQDEDETSAEVVVVSDGLREKRKVEKGEKAEKRARKGKPLEGFL